jgi:hypothetical protein
MSARKKSDKNKPAGPALEVNKDSELEKKVDDMLSVEEPAPDTTKDEKIDPAPAVPEIVEESTAPAVTSPPTEDEKGGAPLLPTDKLPNLDKKKSIPVTSEADAKEPEPEIPEIEEPTGEEPEVALPGMQPIRFQKKEDATPLKDELGLEDVGTSKAVDDIIAAEADELLANRDHTSTPAAPPTSKGNPLKRFFGAWWRSKFWRTLTILAILAAIAAVGAVPASRYFLLNAAGVRSATSVKVLDDSTGLPLKNAEFSVASQTGKTDAEGNVRLDGLKLGKTTMSVKKPAFADFSQPVTLGWGSNPLGEFRLKAVGSQFKFTVVDFLSKIPITKAEANNGDANARSNDKGEILLTVPQTDKDKIEVKISGENYRPETQTVSADQKDTVTVQLVPSRKHVFISKRSGKYDVYKVDVDGKNEEKVLSGTGKERVETMALIPHPTKNVAALVSSRDGASVSTLTLIDLNDNTTSKLAQSERLQVIDWMGNRLVYGKIAEGSSETSTDRHRLMSYDIDSDSEKELASTNYFNDIIAVKNAIYYSPAAYNVKGSVGLYKINADGTNKKTIYDKEVWNLFRTAYDKLSVSMGADWYELNLDNDSLTKAAGPPPLLKTRIYSESPDGNSSLWIDDRDGKGAILSYDQQKKTDDVLRTQSGLKNPVRWLTDKHVIYRISNNTETADYILNIDGGVPLKVRDVTDTAGVDRWYYY